MVITYEKVLNLLKRSHFQKGCNFKEGLQLSKISVQKKIEILKKIHYGKKVNDFIKGPGLSKKVSNFHKRSIFSTKGLLFLEIIWDY